MASIQLFFVCNVCRLWFLLDCLLSIPAQHCCTSAANGLAPACDCCAASGRVYLFVQLHPCAFSSSIVLPDREHPATCIQHAACAVVCVHSLQGIQRLMLFQAELIVSFHQLVHLTHCDKRKHSLLGPHTAPARKKRHGLNGADSKCPLN